MSTESASTSPSEPVKGLPPVHAPSGRHIVQLFLVPGLIVAGAVTILLGFSWLAGGSRTPDQFLKNIDSANPDIRWRAASDLAQVLKRDDKLAADPIFALRLTQRFVKALDELDRLEKARAELPSEADKADIATANKNVLAQRNYVQYLGASLGNFSVPVSAPVLVELARTPRGHDEKQRVLMRRQAVWALANLGDGAHRYAKLNDAQKADIIRKLEEEAKSENADSRRWADAALGWLKEKHSLGVIPALAECAKDERDMFLREQVALALNFWEGDADEQRLAEQTLLTLAGDRGRGVWFEIEDDK